jgi:hypothetical protein
LAPSVFDDIFLNNQQKAGVKGQTSGFNLTQFSTKPYVYILDTNIKKKKNTVSRVRQQQKQEIRVWDTNKNENANKTIFKYHYLSHSPPTIKLFFCRYTN